MTDDESGRVPKALADLKENIKTFRKFGRRL